MYDTIVGSLNISLSNNPVFLGGHVVRLERLEVICPYGFRCHPRLICRVWHLCFLPLSRLIYIARHVLSSLNVSSGRTKFEIFREHTSFCITTLVTIASYAISYHGCHIYLCPVPPEITVTFLVESYKSVLERSYVSCINFIYLFVVALTR